jgi:acyl carrier protein
MSSRLDQLINMVARVLRISPAEIGPDGQMNVTPKWDSLAQLNILVVIEQECGLTIEPEEAVELTSIRALAAFLDRAAPR